MRAAQKRRVPRQGGTSAHNRTAANLEVTAKPFAVQIVSPLGRITTWGQYATRPEAEAEAAKLRHHKFFAQIRLLDGGAR